MSAAMDNSSDDNDIAAIASLNNEFFYTHFFEESDTESDDDANLMLAMASILHEENEVSVPGRAANLDRNREAGHVQLYADYFHLEMALYQNYFRRCFRISRKLFGQIMEGVRLYDPYFKCKPNATGKLGLSSY
jgi:hypothetical protein